MKKDIRTIGWEPVAGKIHITGGSKNLEFTLTKKINDRMKRGGAVNIEFNLEGTFFIAKPVKGKLFKKNK